MTNRTLTARIVMGAIILLQCLPFVVAAEPATPTPLKGTADGTIAVISAGPEGVSISGSAAGHATHLGLFTREELLLLNPVAGSFTGEMVFTAANGDQLWCTFAGNFISETDATGVYTITGGTGRFEQASGEATFSASLPDGVHFTVQFEGNLDW